MKMKRTTSSDKLFARKLAVGLSVLFLLGLTCAIYFSASEWKFETRRSLKTESLDVAGNANRDNWRDRLMEVAVSSLPEPSLVTQQIQLPVEPGGKPLDWEIIRSHSLSLGGSMGGEIHNDPNQSLTVFIPEDRLDAFRMKMMSLAIPSSPAADIHSSEPSAATWVAVQVIQNEKTDKTDAVTLFP